jgi:iron(III) transport system ATP-binding protein
MIGIELHSIVKAYHGQPVLRGVDLDVPDGSVLALLGPSGCGKTTLLRLIAGFERADGGEIRLGPTTVEANGRFVPPERRHVGYVPQEGALFPHLRVAGNVGYGLPRRERKGPRVRDVLHLVGLAELGSRYPHELSGGQQQRAALARALAPDPALILLDEPFNALDLDQRRRMSEEVVALLRRAGTTAVLVTHDPAEAFAAADLVAVMHDGAVLQCGAPADVYGAPANAAVARLTGATVFLDGVMRGGKAETVVGIVPVASPAPDDGRRVTLLLRPEQLHLVEAPAGRAATILERHFRGSHTVLLVAVDGLRLNVRAEQPPADPIVHLEVRGSARVFPA